MKVTTCSRRAHFVSVYGRNTARSSQGPGPGKVKPFERHFILLPQYCGIPQLIMPTSGLGRQAHLYLYRQIPAGHPRRRCPARLVDWLIPQSNLAGQTQPCKPRPPRAPMAQSGCSARTLALTGNSSPAFDKPVRRDRAAMAATLPTAAFPCQAHPLNGLAVVNLGVECGQPWHSCSTATPSSTIVAAGWFAPRRLEPLWRTKAWRPWPNIMQAVPPTF